MSCRLVWTGNLLPLVFHVNIVLGTLTVSSVLLQVSILFLMDHTLIVLIARSYIIAANAVATPDGNCRRKNRISMKGWSSRFLWVISGKRSEKFLGRWGDTHGNKVCVLFGRWKMNAFVYALLFIFVFYFLSEKLRINILCPEYLNIFATLLQLSNNWEIMYRDKNIFV